MLQGLLRGGLPPQDVLLRGPRVAVRAGQRARLEAGFGEGESWGRQAPTPSPTQSEGDDLNHLNHLITFIPVATFLFPPQGPMGIY